MVEPFGPQAVDLSTLVHAWPENASAFGASIQESFAGRNSVNHRASNREGHQERLCCGAQVVTRGREGNLQWLYAVAQGLCLCYKSLVGLANVPCRESEWVLYCDSDQTVHAVPQLKWSADVISNTSDVSGQQLQLYIWSCLVLSIIHHA